MTGISKDEITFDGLKSLSDSEKAVLNKLSTEYFTKIKRTLDNLVALRIKIKTYEKGGEKKKYSIDINVFTPNKNNFNSNKTSDWDFAKALQKSFNAVLTNIKDKTHATSGRKWKKSYE
jgi:hypothetical protein